MGDVSSRAAFFSVKSRKYLTRRSSEWLEMSWGNGGAVGEDSAGGKAMFLAAKFELSVTARNKFKGKVGNILAADVVVRRAVFAPAADDGKRLGLVV